MPYDVTMPDGTVIHDVPEGTTKADLQRRYQAHQVAAQQENKPTSFLQGVGEGAQKVVSNLGHLLAGDINPAALGGGSMLGPLGPLLGFGTDYIDAKVKQASRQLPTRGSNAGRIVGEIGATLPMAAAGGGALAQGALSGMALTDNPKNKKAVLRDALVGAGTSYVADKAIRKVVTPIAKKAVTKLKDLVAPADNAVTAATSDLAPLGQDAVARAEQFQRVGVTNPTTAMVTRDPRAWYAEQEGLKKLGAGDAVLSAYQQADAQLRQAAQKLTEGFGINSAEDSGKIVQNALIKKNDALQAGVSALYNQVRSQSGDVPVGTLEGLRNFIDSPDVVDNATFDSMRSSLVRRLERLGGNVNIGQAEELRKFIGGLGSTADPSVRYMRGQLVNALDDDVVNSVGSDAFKAARDAAKARFEEFSKTFAGDVVQGKFGPERLVPRALSASRPVADVRQLVGSLSDNPQALDTLRKQTLGEIINGAVPNEGGIRAATLRNAVEGNAPKLREILTPEQMASLNDLSQAASNVSSEVPRANVNYSNSASSVANLFPDISPSRFPRLHYALGFASRALGAGMGGTPGYAAAEGINQTANYVSRRLAARVAAQQADAATNPALAASLVKAAQNDQAVAEAIAPYVDKWSRLLAAPVAAGAVEVSH